MNSYLNFGRIWQDILTEFRRKCLKMYRNLSLIKYSGTVEDEDKHKLLNKYLLLSDWILYIRFK